MGFPADGVAEQLVAGGAEGALVNLGGDVRLAGVPPVAEGWRIACSHPVDGSVNAIVALGSGAVVTSTRSRRRWTTVDAEERHHLIDPETGRPAEAGLISVTVVASHAMWGEVVAKAAFVAGIDAGSELIARTGATGLMVTEDGEVVDLPGMEAFLAA
jgi:thiamine biosynthesis lipoprotein